MPSSKFFNDFSDAVSLLVTYIYFVYSVCISFALVNFFSFKIDASGMAILLGKSSHLTVHVYYYILCDFLSCLAFFM